MVRNFKLKRKVKKGEYNLDDIFQGLEYSWIVRNVLKNEFNVMKKEVKIRIVNCNTYMWTDDTDSSIYICKKYLEKGKKKYIYLDILHELIHVWQLKRGMNIYDTRFSYIDRPTEIEAYKYTVEEAKKLGMKKEEIIKYLSVYWLTKEEIIKFAKKLNII